MSNGAVYPRSTVPDDELIDGCCYQLLHYDESLPLLGSWRIGEGPLVLTVPNPKFKSYAFQRYDEIVENGSVLFSCDGGVTELQECVLGLSRFLEHLYETATVSEWLVEPDTRHPIAYWRADAAVVNADIHPIPGTMREVLTYGVMDLFERIGVISASNRLASLVVGQNA